MLRHTRRDFLKHSTALSATLALPALIPARAFGANDKVCIAVAGIHGRGGSHIDAYVANKNCEVTYLVDPDSRLFDKRAAGVEKKSGKRPQCVQDIRKALEDKSLDAVSVATCNHWHSLITIWACQHGKDVYVEKPCSHNVFEGRKCVEAARKYDRIVQHGTQKRASQSIANTVAAIASGKYGKLLVAKGYCCKPRWSIGFKEVTAPPPELDFDIWLGPARKQPYHENLVHYNWHWFWDTGNGDMGNQGVHEMDVARWGIPGATLPKSVVTLGGRWVNEPDFQDQGQTPNMELSVYDFGGPLLIFETRGLVAKKNAEKKDLFPAKVANEWYLEAGNIIGDKFYAKGSDKGEPIAAPAKKGRSSDHFGNFIECVRSRQRANLNAEIQEGHLSAALCHLGNVSYRLGKPVPFSQQPADFPENEHVEASLKAIKENLVGALGVDLSKATYQLGPKLLFDAKAEKFVNNPAADALLTRKPRPPYVVPEKV